MAMGQLNGVIRQLHRLADLHPMGDGQLLERFVRERDEFAFEMLLKRHGPMVLGVCRRILRQSQDAEDAFQATFLVLVRKAASIHPADMVGNWLYGVACRTALKAKAGVRQRVSRRELGDPVDERDPSETWNDLQEILDAELELLPEKYRALIVLCDLEGRPRKEVAGRLQLPEGTLSSRIATARKLLAQRLTRRGITLAAGALATLLTEKLASASVPTALHTSTFKAVSLTATGTAAVSGVVSAKVAALTEGVLKAMFLTKLKTMMAFLLTLVVLAGGFIGVASHQAPAQQPDTKTEPPKKTDKKPADESKNTDAKTPTNPAPKGEPKKPEPPAKPDTVTTLKDSLKKHELEIAKIRQLMLKEVDAEIEKLEAAIKKSQEDQKKGDRTAFQKTGQLTGEKMRLKTLRYQVEHGINLGGASAKATVPVEVQIGLHVTIPNSTLRQQLALKKDHGLVIDKVTADSAAAKAGLKAHDIVIEFAGKGVPSDLAAFRKLIAASPAGGSVEAVVIRHGKQETVKGLTLPGVPAPESSK